MNNQKRLEMWRKIAIGCYMLGKHLREHLKMVVSTAWH